MSVRGIFLAAALALAAGPATAQGAGGQGFAGMGVAVEGFALPDRATALAFPDDHGPHPDFRLEWWYLTATLTGTDGTDYGIQWTLFRSAQEPRATAGWDSPQLWMGHAGLTTPDRHFSAERFARDGVGQAGVRAVPFHAWIDDWEMRGLIPEGDPRDQLDALELTARGADFAYRLTALAEGPLVLHGEAGFSVKADSGVASHYYSQPFYRVEGVLDLPDGPVAVTGQGWLDREWSSQFLEGDQTGWDWFALVLDDDTRLMAAQVRSGDGPPFVFGTLIAPDGAAQPLLGEDLRLTPLAEARVAGRRVPVHWRVEMPAAGIDVEARAVNPDSWMATTFEYWEGPVRLTGSHTGRGYLEMTGY